MHASKDADCKTNPDPLTAELRTAEAQLLHIKKSETCHTCSEAGKIVNVASEVAERYKADGRMINSTYEDTERMTNEYRITAKDESPTMKQHEHTTDEDHISQYDDDAIAGTDTNGCKEYQIILKQWWAQLTWCSPRVETRAKNVELIVMCRTSPKMKTRRRRADPWKALWGNRLHYNPYRNGHRLYEIIAKAALRDDSQYRRVRRSLANYIQEQLPEECGSCRQGERDSAAVQESGAWWTMGRSSGNQSIGGALPDPHTGGE